MRTLILLIWVLLGNCLLGSWALAQEDASENTRFDEYFTISEPSAKPSAHDPASQIQNSDISGLFWQSLDDSYALAAQVYSLLKFDYHKSVFGNVAEPYDRLKHFGTWISKDPHWNCFNTRAQVLARDSKVQVGMSSNGCTVVSGKWSDPYSGRDFTEASDIQIDHFVPLKNAYVSGAHKWDYKRRCLYANFQGNAFHLVSVYGKENMRKSDHTPEYYMPSNGAFQCQYLANWLKVKSIWGLGLTPPEKTAILDLVQQNHCAASDLTFTNKEIQDQRQYIADNRDLCYQP